MIDMGMGDKDIVDGCRIHRNVLALIEIRPLLHPAVHDHGSVPEFHIMTAACHLMRCAQKFQKHFVPL